MRLRQYLKTGALLSPTQAHALNISTPHTVAASHICLLDDSAFITALRNDRCKYFSLWNQIHVHVHVKIVQRGALKVYISCTNTNAEVIHTPLGKLSTCTYIYTQCMCLYTHESTYNVPQTNTCTCTSTLYVYMYNVYMYLCLVRATASVYPTLRNVSQDMLKSNIQMYMYMYILLRQ